MTRLWLLGVLVCCGLISAEYYTVKQADKDFALKQKKVYNLLYRVAQPAQANRSWYEEGQQWNIEANINLYSNQDAAKNFLLLYKNGMLPRGEIFSVYYPQLLKEMEALFKLFYYANDFDTFYKTALWAKNNLNEGQYCIALYSAVLTRPDTKYIQLPPPYEMYPSLFFNSEVLERAQHAKLFGIPKKQGEDKSYIISANYSGWYLNREYYLENKLNYFTEDIGLNTYYFFFRQALPFWMESKEFGLPSDYRGEEYLYGHKLLLNRYNLERLSNDMPRIEDFDWQKTFYPGYYPTMTFHNGLPMPQRPAWSDFPHYKYRYIQDIMDKESRIRSAIDSGFIFGNDSKKYNIYTDEGANILGNAIEGNADSYNPNFYGSIDRLARKILGYNLEPASKYQIIPSALEMSPTSMRDPAFYRLYKRICLLYYKYKLRQPPYSKEEIVYPNIKIESFNVDKMITYFDEFYTTINNGLLNDDLKEGEVGPLIKIKQYRLNNKPFNFHISVNADKPMRVSIRIFLGPKYDAHRKPLEFPDGFKYFYEIDNWITELNPGMNKILRSSQDCYFTIPDQESSDKFYAKILSSLDSNEPFTYYERVFGFPERLLLPKGKKEGMPFQFFIHISPVTSEFTYSSRVWGQTKFDNKPFGFPIDKPLFDFKYDGPNMMFKDILIYHKDEFDMNISY
ncbi:hexamerin-like [Ceratina calcarata]|uniref:Hexamerin-like n=1 Tax=Ceratina calcarata TaxID=156304 RepID=A0AAJ7NCQ6_9HYME|nr:hexamerin-like [Ceratina calcarata]